MIEKNMPRLSNKLSEFEHIRSEPAKPNTLTLSQVDRMRGVACSVYFDTATESVSRTAYRSVFVFFSLHSATLTLNHGS